MTDLKQEIKDLKQELRQIKWLATALFLLTVVAVLIGAI